MCIQMHMHIHTCIYIYVCIPRDMYIDVVCIIQLGRCLSLRLEAIDPNQKKVSLSWRAEYLVDCGWETLVCQKAIERNLEYHKSVTFKMTFNVIRM